MRFLGRFIPVILALLAASCSRIEEGVVVSKSAGVNSSSFAGLGPAFVVDVEGRDARGKTVTRSSLLPQAEWLNTKIGERFSFKRHGILDDAAAKKPAETPPSKPKRESKAHKAADVAEPKPAPKSQEFLARLFNRTEPSATPAPTPVAHKKKKVRKSSAKLKSVKVKSVHTAAKHPAPISEKQYRQVQTKALEDSEVRDAKQKIHSATNDEEQRRASEEYQRLLFKKMRALDKALSPRIDKEEAEKLGSSPLPSSGN